MPLVFAYGSNLSHDQMAERCPSAAFVGPVRLPGFRLTFTGWSYRWGGGVATVEPVARGTVHGALWHMTTADLMRLDQYEGVPNVYARVQSRLDGAPVHVYARDVRGVTPPGPEYVATIMRGCRESRVSTRSLRVAIRRARRVAALAQYVKALEEEES